MLAWPLALTEAGAGWYGEGGGELPKAFAVKKSVDAEGGMGSGAAGWVVVEKKGSCDDDAACVGGGAMPDMPGAGMTGTLFLGATAATGLVLAL